MFKDREDAGKLLAEAIKKKKWDLNKRDSIILALPRGGVIVAAELSKALKIPFDIIVTRKIGAPLNPEYAIAAVGLNSVVKNPREEIDRNFLNQEIAKERKEIIRRLNEYKSGKYPDLKNKKVILVDDGLATGLTMKAAIKETKTFNPQKIFLAVPVAPPQTIEELKKQIDDYVVISIEPMFFAIGQFYQSFEQTQDDEVKNILNSL